MTVTQRMTFLAAAQAILSRARRPMTSREIMNEALRRELVQTAGSTPQKSLDAVLYSETKRPDSRFVRLSEPGPTRAKRGSVRWTLSKRRATLAQD